MRMSDLVENVSKKPIPPYMKTLLVEVMVNDENDEDVEVSHTPLRFSSMSLIEADISSARSQVPFCVIHI